MRVRPLNQYDRNNVPKFLKHDENAYLCSICGQYTSLHDSVSCQGYNLICSKCEFKLRHLLDNDEILLDIQKAGHAKMMEYEHIFKDRSGNIIGG